MSIGKGLRTGEDNDLSPSAPRKALRVQEVAKILSCDDSHVRKLVKSGFLHAFHIGARGIRIYADTVRDFQENKPVRSLRQGRGGPSPVKRVWQSQPHREAMAFLQDNGVF